VLAANAPHPTLSPARAGARGNTSPMSAPLHTCSDLGCSRIKIAAYRRKIPVHAPTVDRTNWCEARVTATYRARRPAGVAG